MSVEKKKKIFNEFEGISKVQWLKQAIKDLKDPEKYQWASDEGLTIDPFYTQEDLINHTLPSTSAFSNGNWKYFEAVEISDEKEANKQALSALNNGADGIIFKVTGDALPDFRKLFKDILLQYCHIILDIQGDKIDIIKYYFNYLTEHKFSTQEVKGALRWDPLIEWTLGDTKSNPSFNNLGKMLNSSDADSDFRFFSITSEVYKNSGATAIQEVSLIVSSLIEYIRLLSQSGIAPEVAFRKSWFIVSTGKNYFFEIAKIRALKLLVLQIAKTYKVQNFNENDLNLHVTTSWWTKTAKDPYTNILRNTTEAMAGILGGCSSLSILPHDIVSKDYNEFSGRISRNISNILKEEAYMDKVSNPVDGSYYVENLTQQMLQKIWENVQKIEEQGGFSEAFKKGFILDMVAPNYKKAIESLIKVEDKVIGSNSFKNQGDIEINLLDTMQPKGWFTTTRLTEILERNKDRS